MLNIKYTYNNSKDNIFLDISPRVFTPLLEIIRRNFSENNEPIDKIHILVSCSNDCFKEEAKRLFGDDCDKVLSRFMLDFCTKGESKRLQKIREELEKNLIKNTKYWAQGIKIKCYKCGLWNDGTFWKLKLSYDRHDEFCVDGYYSTCKKCDPDGTYKV